MNTRYAIAVPEDYDEIIDLANYVFSHDHGPHDFPVLLPKLYRPDYFADAVHYLAREDGRIKAVIGAYPLAWEFPEGIIAGRGVGMVSVHPYCRSRGYMKTLMHTALEDMKRDRMIFSCLGGQRQRYEYFGYAPAGMRYTFACTDANIRHTLGRKTAGLALKPVSPDDTALLDAMYALHTAETVRLRRSRERFYAILSSWNARIFAVLAGTRFQGYLTGTDSLISEIRLTDNSLFAEVIGLFLQEQHKKETQISVGPHETEKIAALAGFAEDYCISPAYRFAVFDYVRFLAPFLALQSRLKPLPDGSFVLQIEKGPRLELSARSGNAAIRETDAPAEAVLNRLDALRFLGAAFPESAFPAVRQNAFLSSLLPLPVFFGRQDML
ncbi:MAG: GNAT family N-acetyltransferase [Spirochaetaceae bacterium]|jgi:predicted N-acetyltransferase YhbS|nr:GNAT family N-acetyltransferase [Spirochaetaceae bacterium]